MEIHEQLKEVYGETCMQCAMVGKWVKQFTEGRADVNDLQHSRQLSDSMSLDNMQQLRDLLDEDCCETIFGIVFSFVSYRLW